MRVASSESIARPPKFALVRSLWQVMQYCFRNAASTPGGWDRVTCGAGAAARCGAGGADPPDRTCASPAVNATATIQTTTRGKILLIIDYWDYWVTGPVPSSVLIRAIELGF